MYAETVDTQTITQASLQKEYEQCVFINCDLSGLDLRDVSFEECRFSGCNFTDVKINNTALKQIQFYECKMLGLQFADSNPFLLEMSFEKCQLDYSSFYQLKLKKTKFEDCSLRDVDFVEAELTEVNFSGSDLYAATFERTILTKADLRTAKNYNLDPEVNTMTNAQFSVQGLAGLLDKHKLNIT